VTEESIHKDAQHQLPNNSEKSQPNPSPNTILRKGLILGDAPGLGKTIVVLALLAYIRRWDFESRGDQPSGELSYVPGTLGRQCYPLGTGLHLCGLGSLADIQSPIIIVVPLSIQRQWMTESVKWLKKGTLDFFEYPNRANELASWWHYWDTSSSPVHLRVIVATHNALIMKNPEKHTSEVRALSLANLRPWMVIVDEVHNVRNAGSKLFQGMCALVEHARIRIGLTATPIYNRLEDVLNIANLLGLEQHRADGFFAEALLRKILPNYRRRAQQYRSQHLSTGEEDTPPDATIVKLSESLFEEVSFGGVFLMKCVALVQALYGPSYLRRDHSSCNWEGKPLVELPSKSVERRKLTLPAQEKALYDATSVVSYQEMRGEFWAEKTSVSESDPSLICMFDFAAVGLFFRSTSCIGAPQTVSCHFKGCDTVAQVK
jgi:SNF2 family DNA or RNA helicase